MIKVQKQKINISEQNKKLLMKKIGAAVNFIGIARPTNNSGKIKYIEIEHYPKMTEIKIKEIEIFATKKWKLDKCIIIHRYGKIKPGENIVYVGTATQHRNNAFKACEFIIDYLKVKAPFWKIEKQNNTLEKKINFIILDLSEIVVVVHIDKTKNVFLAKVSS